MTARVTAVPDGDSLVVADRDGREYRVRLYGLDAPEGGQPHGAEAARFLAAAVAGREVVLKTLDRDVYGRLVALVCLEDGEPVNRRLVSAGLAWVYTAYCHIPECAQWRKDEARARRDRRGLWQAPHPTPPWKYRRQGQG
jgi:endonuclease YncB( thermonuclease family)